MSLLCQIELPPGRILKLDDFESRDGVVYWIRGGPASVVHRGSQFAVSGGSEVVLYGGLADVLERRENRLCRIRLPEGASLDGASCEWCDDVIYEIEGGPASLSQNGCVVPVEPGSRVVLYRGRRQSIDRPAASRTATLVARLRRVLSWRVAAVLLPLAGALASWFWLAGADVVPALDLGELARSRSDLYAQLLESPSRSVLSGLLAEVPGDKLWRWLIAFNDLPEEEQLLLLTVLSFKERPEAIPLVELIIKDPSLAQKREDVVVQAIEAFRTCARRYPDLAILLEPFTRHPSLEVRCTALRDLGAFANPRLDYVFIRVLKDSTKPPEELGSAVWGLTFLASPDHWPYAEPYEHYPYADLQHAVATLKALCTR